MRLRRFAQTCAAISGLAIAALAAPANAHDKHRHSEDTRPDWREGRQGWTAPAMDPRARENWLADCRHRISSRDNGIGGAVIGGLVGGLAGNRLAGAGNRTVGTVAGAAIGAVAGAAIDKAEDRGPARDDCEAFLDDYYARGGYGYGYGQPGYAVPMVMVPVMLVPRGQPECKETVEYVYENVPARRTIRRAPRRAPRHVPDKRIRIAPDKRVRG